MKKPMVVATILEELRSERSLLSEPVGFVPTMGYLHDGHLSLIRRAVEECVSVVVSIFVNPTQFGPKEDLATYPRDIEGDLRKLESMGVNLVWIPTSEVMYPGGYQTWVDVETLTLPLEGKLRPGHFRGVTTVVVKLFNGVLPGKAYFGQKDAQQVAVIRQMTRDLNIPTEIVVCPIIREPDGLAMSSRNAYLDPDQRKAATVLFLALTNAKDAYGKGERNGENLRVLVREMIVAESLAEIQYVSCADFGTLQELDTLTGKTLLSIAVFFGKTRLIDNIVLV